MDGSRFDNFTRSLREARSRRDLNLLLGGLALGSVPILRGLGEAEARRKKRKGKKRRSGSVPGDLPQPICSPLCLGKRCGDNGCGGSCGACTQCQTCELARAVCLMQPGSDTTACTGGACCGGACCPPSCQCGIEGLGGALAEEFAATLGLPYPFCAASGTGNACGTGLGSCPAGTECYLPSGLAIGICAGLCAGVVYPSL